ncbi:MAG: ribosome rescue protein RqcH [Candidatus Bathyarchaeia archaeon]
MKRPLPKSVMTSFDVYVAVNELAGQIVGKTIGNIYQLKEAVFLLKLSPGGLQLIIEPERRIHLTKYRLEVPEEPPQFCKELRKHLRRSRIRDIRQHKFDRVVVLEVTTAAGSYQLVAEIFRRGNLILVDSNGRIITAYRFARMRDRNILRGEPYFPAPSSGIEPQRLQAADLQLIKGEVDPFKALRSLLPFPPSYLQEVLMRSGLEGKASGIDDRDAAHIIEEVSRILDEHQLSRISPRVVLNENGDCLDVIPAPLRIYDNYAYREYPTFNEALDEYFSRLDLDMGRSEAESVYESKVEERKRVISALTEEKRKVEEEIEQNTRIGRLLLRHNLPLQDLIMKMRQGKPSEADLEVPVVEIDAKKRRVKIRLSDLEFWVSYQDNPFQNAGAYFDAAKELKRKLRGIEASLYKVTKELKDSEAELASKRSETSSLTVKRKREWYEKFRWFRSSDDFLVLIGKDAATNQTLIERYTSPDDIVFHADIHGAPFAVIKSEGRQVPERTLHEASVAAASYSRAWPSGYLSVDVYWVKPEQLSKTPPSGEYIAKGMYMIYGKRNYIKGVRLGLAVGAYLEKDSPRIIGGPVEAVRSKTSVYVEIIPSRTYRRRLAHEVLQRLICKAPKDLRDKLKGIEIEEVQAFIPAGKGEIV